MRFSSLSSFTLRGQYTPGREISLGQEKREKLLVGSLGLLGGLETRGTENTGFPHRTFAGFWGSAGNCDGKAGKSP